MIEIVPMSLVVAVSYLLGSIPNAYIIARLKGINIFEIGSGNMGATNVVRATSIWWGLLVWLLDSLKGVLAILISHQIMPNSLTTATVLAATSVVVGHNWSLFASMITGKLRGGKGAATALGTMLMIAPLHVFVGICFVGGLIIALTRYISLAVLTMFTVSTLWLLVLIQQNALPSDYAVYTLAITAMIIFRHRENIQRLLAGKERRLGERA